VSRFLDLDQIDEAVRTVRGALRHSKFRTVRDYINVLQNEFPACVRAPSSESFFILFCIDLFTVCSSVRVLLPRCFVSPRVFTLRISRYPLCLFASRYTLCPHYRTYSSSCTLARTRRLTRLPPHSDCQDYVELYERARYGSAAMTMRDLNHANRLVQAIVEAIAMT
jgi:hypothetical protein